MQNGPKTVMTTRQPKPAASFAARSKRWTSSATRPESKGSQNAQRSYERYLALAQAAAVSGDTVYTIRNNVAVAIDSATGKASKVETIVSGLNIPIGVTPIGRDVLRNFVNPRRTNR